MAGGGIAKMGNKVAPPRFILFVVLLVAASIGAGLATDWPHGIMIGFDVAAFLFLVSSLPLLNDSAGEMRRHSAENDANRAGLLGLTVAVTTVVLVTVGAEVAQSGHPPAAAIALIVGTLVLAWLFSNVIYALH